MLVIIPRGGAADYGSVAEQFGGIPGCRIIRDRRLAARRHDQHPWPGPERRRRERRTGRLEGSCGLVVFLR